VKGDITLLLARLAAGDRSAENSLMPLVYVELHRLAQARLKSERPDHTLQATALVHEVYLRMCRSNDLTYHDRVHFYRIAATLMRRVLVDYARQRGARKRSDGAVRVPIEGATAISENRCDEALEIDRLLNKLAEFSPRQAQVVEMRFFGGLDEQEIADCLGKSVRTIRRDWLMARAWLHEQLKASGTSD
jgi:RNA polymerase sigma-70 factor, ECF subfamily